MKLDLLFPLFKTICGPEGDPIRGYTYTQKSRLFNFPLFKNRCCVVRKSCPASPNTRSASDILKISLSIQVQKSHSQTLRNNSVSFGKTVVLQTTCLRHASICFYQLLRLSDDIKCRQQVIIAKNGT